MNTDVLIAGAGPVGLLLALDLGRRGVRCTLIERLDAPSGYPKMERCNARTMEIFRRLGIAEQVRAAGYPPDWPMDTFLVFDLTQPPLFTMKHPSVAELKTKTAATNDGTMPCEPYQIISQYTLEPLLKGLVETMPSVTVKFGHAFESFEVDADGVTSRIRTSAGKDVTIRSKYLVGCDGAASAVRRQLGFKLEGESLRVMWQALFRCDELYDDPRIPKGRHYHRIDPYWTFMIVQDSRKHFTIHAIVDSEDEMPKLFERIVGRKVEYEMLHCGQWTQRLMLSTGYAKDRVFIAGDSAHLVIPTGGLGMNTGVGDAIDLSWKLAATLQGWGGPGLLPSYEAERRPIGARNVKASGGGTSGREKWRAAYTPEIEDATPQGQAARDHLVKIARDEAPKSFRVTGAELGYRYDGSPIICGEKGNGPENPIEEYRPTTWPGARLPHVWAEPGVSVLDLISDGYTLLRLGKGGDAAPLARAFAALGAPFNVLDVDAAAARAVYGFDTLLLRPDLHVCWRGNALPSDPAAVARKVTGH